MNYLYCILYIVHQLLDIANRLWASACHLAMIDSADWVISDVLSLLSMSTLPSSEDLSSRRIPSCSLFFLFWTQGKHSVWYLWFLCQNRLKRTWSISLVSYSVLNCSSMSLMEWRVSTCNRLRLKQIMQSFPRDWWINGWTSFRNRSCLEAWSNHVLARVLVDAVMAGTSPGANNLTTIPGGQGKQQVLVFEKLSNPRRTSDQIWIW